MADKVITRIASLPKPATFKEAAKAVQRVAAYARVSTDHEDQASSLVAQTEYYKKKIMEHPGWEFVEIYVDDGISGLSTSRRDGFNQMIEDCLAGHIDLVLTKSISRFARNTVDTVTTIRRLKERGVAVFFEKENIFTTDSKGEFLLTVMSSLAQEESRSISENVTWGKRKQAADGKVSLAYSRFMGYDKGDEKFTMVINKEQAVVVRRIFRLFLQGFTPHSIAGILTEDGILSPSGCDSWNQQTVRRMLSNEKYKGDALLQKEFTADYLTKKMKKNEGELPQYYVKEDHEPIISPWLFDYVQEKLKERVDCPAGTRYSGVTALSSKVECGACGSLFMPRPWHSTSSYNHLVWQCRSRTRRGPKCRVPNVYDKMLHYILHDIARTATFKRGVSRIVMDIVAAVIGEERAGDLQEWTDTFQKKSIWKLVSDEDDLSIVIRRITVMQNRKIQIRWIDGRTDTRNLPNYKPSKGIIGYDKKAK